MLQHQRVVMWILIIYILRNRLQTDIHSIPRTNSQRMRQAWRKHQFEPKIGKGGVARAVLYFLLRYPGKFEKEMVNLELLLSWHKEHPVTI